MRFVDRAREEILEKEDRTEEKEFRLVSAVILWQKPLISTKSSIRSSSSVL